MPIVTNNNFVTSFFTNKQYLSCVLATRNTGGERLVVKSYPLDVREANDF